MVSRPPIWRVFWQNPIPKVGRPAKGSFPKVPRRVRKGPIPSVRKWTSKKKKWTKKKTSRGAVRKAPLFRSVKTKWTKLPRSVRIASNFIPGVGPVRYGVRTFRLVRGGRVLKSTRKVKGAFVYLAREVAVDLLMGATLAGGIYYYSKRKSRSKSRGREHTERSARVAGPLGTRKSMRGPSAQKKITRRSRRSRRRRQYCRKHKRYDFCYFYAKR